MVGRKRAAPAAEDGASEKRQTRSAKAAKSDTAKSPKNAGKGQEHKKTGRGKKAGPKVTASAFKAHALPLHVHLTHTPPAAPEAGSEVAQADPGFIAGLTLVAASFGTGSFGWKGSRRVAIELPAVEGEAASEEGKAKETVQVMLTINATVMGSKDVKDEADVDGEVGDAPKEQEQDGDAPEATKEVGAEEETAAVETAEAPDEAEEEKPQQQVAEGTEAA